MLPFNTIPLAILAMVLLVPCLATEEQPVPISEEREGSQCDKNNKVAEVCIACAGLPFNVAVDLVDCCTEEKAYQFCDACVHDQASCRNVMLKIEAVLTADPDDDYYDDGPVDSVLDDLDTYADAEDPDAASGAVEKRFGTLFMKSPKRYGRLFFGKRSPVKRFGRLYMGSGGYFGKRASDDEQDFLDSVDRMDKRFGYILGSSYKLGKRAGGEFESDEYAVPPKRYGQLFLNRGGMFGRRGKRFGRLFVGGKGMFGKRSADVDKRFGRLFTGPRRGKFFG